MEENNENESIPEEYEDYDYDSENYENYVVENDVQDFIDENELEEDLDILVESHIEMERLKENGQEL